MSYFRYFFIYFYWFPCLGSMIWAQSYIYPVMECDNRVFLLYQQNMTTTLFEWDPHTYAVYPVLAPWHNPTHVTLLPSKKGFSFIDNDMVMVKYFDQRTAYSIPLQKPLYNFTLIHWIDDEHFYCSAMNTKTFGIYEISIQGDILEKVVDDTIDCLYPQKRGDNVYFIAREYIQDEYVYTIRRSLYTALSCAENAEICINTGTMPLIFLNLHPVEGNAVLSYQCDTIEGREVIKFFYYAIEIEKKRIHSLFSFIIPQKYIKDSADIVCESLLPVLPRVRGNCIYFSSYDGLYIFDKIKHCCMKCVDSFLFSFITVPLACGLYGGDIRHIIPCIQFEPTNCIHKVKIPLID